MAATAVHGESPHNTHNHWNLPMCLSRGGVPRFFPRCVRAVVRVNWVEEPVAGPHQYTICRCSWRRKESYNPLDAAVLLTAAPVVLNAAPTPSCEHRWEVQQCTVSLPRTPTAQWAPLRLQSEQGTPPGETLTLRWVRRGYADSPAVCLVTLHDTGVCVGSWESPPTVYRGSYSLATYGSDWLPPDPDRCRHSRALRGSKQAARAAARCGGRASTDRTHTRPHETCSMVYCARWCCCLLCAWLG